MAEYVELVHPHVLLWISLRSDPSLLYSASTLYSTINRSHLPSGLRPRPCRLFYIRFIHVISMLFACWPGVLFAKHVCGQRLVPPTDRCQVRNALVLGAILSGYPSSVQSTIGFIPLLRRLLVRKGSSYCVNENEIVQTDVLLVVSSNTTIEQLQHQASNINTNNNSRLWLLRRNLVGPPSIVEDKLQQLWSGRMPPGKYMVHASFVRVQSN